MRTFARKQEQPQQKSSFVPKRSANDGPIVDVRSETPAANQFAHDFSRIPAHGPRGITIQTRLAVNTPGDVDEQEADRISELVMRMPESKKQSPCACGGSCANCQTTQPSQEQSRLQTKQRGSGQAGQMPAPSSVHEVLASPGQPLDWATRAYMEPRLGHDFSEVRIYHSAVAAKSAQDVSAKAYTVGHNIVFGEGQFAPATQLGARLIAHELIHVMQQGGGHQSIQRQPAPSTRLLSPAAAAAAVADVTRRYDEESIRTMEKLSARNPDGTFDTNDAEAVARLQQLGGLTPNGRIDEPLINALLGIVGPTVAARSALIHLVIDHASLDVSSAVSVVWAPGLSTASDIDTFAGGVIQIQIGPTGFASYSVMVAEIRRRLATRTPASPVASVPPAVLTNPDIQKVAIALNQNLLKEPRSIRLLQGALGSRVTGRWDVSLVRHIAAKQQALGLTPHGGILFDATFAAIGTEMISRGGEDAVLQMIVDYYKLDRSGVLNIVFDPIAPPPPHDKANAQTTSVGGSGTPGVVRVFPRGFAQPFAGLVHTVAHELGHIEQVIQGIASENVREFLSNGIEIESKNLPEESIESDADIDLINRSLPPTQGGLIDDTFSMLRWWSLMTPSEKQAHHQRYRELRDIIFRRIVTQATSSQKSKLAGLIIQLADADQGVP